VITARRQGRDARRKQRGNNGAATSGSDVAARRAAQTARGANGARRKRRAAQTARGSNGARSCNQNIQYNICACSAQSKYFINERREIETLQKQKRTTRKAYESCNMCQGARFFGTKGCRTKRKSAASDERRVCERSEFSGGGRHNTCEDKAQKRSEFSNHTLQHVFFKSKEVCSCTQQSAKRGGGGEGEKMHCTPAKTACANLHSWPQTVIFNIMLQFFNEQIRERA